MKLQKQLVIFDHCIACSTCSSVSPTVFGLNASGTTAMILSQPTNALVEKKSIEAMRSCPVHAIGVK